MAYKNASRLLRAVKASGLPYTEVAGWKTRGRREMGTIRTITCHHTATPRSVKRSTDYPTMGVVRDGRPGIPGPLAQIGLGRSGRVYLIAAGVANHAGRSRAVSMTNPHAIGIEAEGAMEAWPKAQYDAYVRLVAALANEFPGVQILGHKESASPPGRKNDPSFNMNSFRKAVAAARKRPSKPTPAPAPEKGFFGMSGYERRTRVGDQHIAPHSNPRVALHPKTKTSNGALYIARPRRRGQKFLLQADASIRSVPAGADIKAAIVICYYFRDGGHEITRPFEEVSFPAGANGWSSVHLGQIEQFGGTQPGEKRGGKVVQAVDYQLEITNHSSKPVTVVRASSGSFYE